MGLPVLGMKACGFSISLFMEASRDLSHVLFAITSGDSVASEAARPPAVAGDSDRARTENLHVSLYEYTAGGAEGAEPRLVGVENEGPLDGSPHVNEGAKLVSDCGTDLGSKRRRCRRRRHRRKRGL